MNWVAPTNFPIDDKYTPKVYPIDTANFTPLIADDLSVATNLISSINTLNIALTANKTSIIKFRYTVNEGLRYIMSTVNKITIIINKLSNKIQELANRAPQLPPGKDPDSIINKLTAEKQKLKEIMVGVTNILDEIAHSPKWGGETQLNTDSLNATIAALVEILNNVVIKGNALLKDPPVFSGDIPPLGGVSASSVAGGGGSVAGGGGSVAGGGGGGGGMHQKGGNHSHRHRRTKKSRPHKKTKKSRKINYKGGYLARKRSGRGRRKSHRHKHTSYSQY